MPRVRGDERERGSVGARAHLISSSTSAAPLLRPRAPFAHAGLDRRRIRRGGKRDQHAERRAPRASHPRLRSSRGGEPRGVEHQREMVRSSAGRLPGSSASTASRAPKPERAPRGGAVNPSGSSSTQRVADVSDRHGLRCAGIPPRTERCSAPARSARAASRTRERRQTHTLGGM